MRPASWACRLRCSPSSGSAPAARSFPSLAEESSTTSSTLKHGQPVVNSGTHPNVHQRRRKRREVPAFVLPVLKHSSISRTQPMDKLKHVAINKNTSENTTATNSNTTEVAYKISLDRLTICFVEPNAEGVKKSAGLLLDDHYVKAIPGMKVTKNQRYHVSCTIPFPIDTNGQRHPVCF